MLQVIVWVTYVSVATTLFITKGRRARLAAATPVVPPSPSDGIAAADRPFPAEQAERVGTHDGSREPREAVGTPIQIQR